jgi:ergothioneine biosynthesis protein EgtB
MQCHAVQSTSPTSRHARQPTEAPATLDDLRQRFLRVRATTEALCWPLSAEDASAQSMPDASPTKWHLAHTTWFFETFVLADTPNFRPYHPEYGRLFNSYYDALGARIPRHARGLCTRPSLDEVKRYREVITTQVADLLSGSFSGLVTLRHIELGIQHEQQHQELILTDIKHLLGQNPLAPAYQPQLHVVAEPVVRAPGRAPQNYGFRSHEGGLVPVGNKGQGFAFDNETPEHLVYLEPYALADRLVTIRDYLEFMRDGGYERPELWLADGWRFRCEQQICRPLYVRGNDDDLHLFTLSGIVPLPLDEPICHVSYYEADAYARWADARLPTEAEWEHAARAMPVTGNLLESGRLQPAPCRAGQSQLFGDVWEWTKSSYDAYPGYQAPPGPLGEYNGKFMCNQMVLRGGSCATPSQHIRSSYRNFFPPETRWQFSGIRLARDP